MGHSESIIKGTTIYAIGNFGSKLLVFLLTPLFSFYLTKSEFGVYDLVLTTVNILFPICSLQISEAAYRFMVDSKGSLYKKVFSNVLVIFIVLFVFFLLILTPIKSRLNFQYYGFFIVLLFLTSLFTLTQQVIRGINEKKEYAKFGIFNALFLVFFNFFFLVFLKRGIIGVFMATIISYVIVIAYAFYKLSLMKLFDFKEISFGFMLKMTKYSSPLIPNAISWFLISTLNKYVILAILGVSANGIYAVSSRFPSLIAVISSIFMLAWQDFIIKENSSEEIINFSKKMFNEYTKLFFCIALILIPASKYLVLILIDEAYIESYKYMSILFLAAILSSFCAFLGAIYLKRKNTNYLFATTMLGGILNILISYFFMPIMGLYAPAIGTALGFLVVFLLRKMNLKKEFPIFDTNVVNRFLFFLVILECFLVLLDYNIINVFLLLLGTILFYFYNHSVILKFKYIILKK